MILLRWVPMRTPEEADPSNGMKRGHEEEAVQTTIRSWHHTRTIPVYAKFASD